MEINFQFFLFFDTVVVKLSNFIFWKSAKGKLVFDWFFLFNIYRGFTTIFLHLIGFPFDKSSENKLLRTQSLNQCQAASQTL